MKSKQPKSHQRPVPTTQVNLYEAKTHLSELVEAAAAGQEIVIAKAGEPKARLVPLAAQPHPERRPGRWKGKIWMADDFDAPLPPDILAAFYGEDEAGEIDEEPRDSRT